MNCPLCDRALDPTTLLEAEGDRPALQGFRCPDGHGVFLPSDVYVEWQATDDASAPDAESVTIDAGDVGDVKRAKLCPQEIGRAHV